MNDGGPRTDSMRAWLVVEWDDVEAEEFRAHAASLVASVIGGRGCIQRLRDVLAGFPAGHNKVAVLPDLAWASAAEWMAAICSGRP